MTRWGALAIPLVAAIAAARWLVGADATGEFRNWLHESGWRGQMLFGIMYVAATLAMVPGSAVTLLGGAAFGVWRGFFIVSLASTTGSALAFLIARYCARQWVVGLSAKYPRFAAIDQAIAEGGWKVVALLRLSPAIPFNVQNYLYGLTAIQFWPCVITSWVAMWPGTFLYVYLGYLAALAVEEPPTLGAWRWLLLGVGLVATAAATAYLTHLAAGHLRPAASAEGGVAPRKDTQ